MSTFPRSAAALALLLLLAPSARAQTAPPAATQIAGAVAPLPDSMRAGARVLGYRDGQLVQLRAGSNPMVCLADDPAQEGFHTACYHRDMDPFMARGRALKAAGVGKAALDSTRLAEIAAGTLPMPKTPVTLYSIFLKDDIDPAAGVPADAPGLYVIYMPYATEASSGISAQPAAKGPWLMYPGLPTAHVMIPR